MVASLTCDTCHARGKSFVGAPVTVVEPGSHIPIGATACQNCHSATNFTSFVIPNAVPPMNHAVVAAQKKAGPPVDTATFDARMSSACGFLLER